MILFQPNWANIANRSETNQYVKSNWSIFTQHIPRQSPQRHSFTSISYTKLIPCVLVKKLPQFRAFVTSQRDHCSVWMPYPHSTRTQSNGKVSCPPPLTLSLQLPSPIKDRSPLICSPCVCTTANSTRYRGDLPPSRHQFNKTNDNYPVRL